jgi:hypothetical protein
MPDAACNTDEMTILDAADIHPKTLSVLREKTRKMFDKIEAKHHHDSIQTPHGPRKCASNMVVTSTSLDDFDEGIALKSVMKNILHTA